MRVPWGWISAACFGADYVLRKAEETNQANELAEARALDDKRAELQLQYDTLKSAYDRQNEKVRHLLELKERVWQQEQANLGINSSPPSPSVATKNEPLVMMENAPPPRTLNYTSCAAAVKSRHEAQNRRDHTIQIIGYLVVIGVIAFVFFGIGRN